MIRWLTLALGATLLVGCVSPYRSYPTPLYLPPPYVAQPLIETPRSGPVPLFPAPAPRPEPAPAPEPLDEPATVPNPEPQPVPEPEAAAPAPAAPENSTARPRAGQGADAPLQGFRPMRGQTRPGI